MIFDLHGQATFDVVTSRAVAPLERLLGWSMPLVAPTGALVAMKGRSVHEEIAAVADSLATWRCGAPEVFEVGVGLVDQLHRDRVRRGCGVPRQERLR